MEWIQELIVAKDEATGELVFFYSWEAYYTWKIATIQARKQTGVV